MFGGGLVVVWGDLGRFNGSVQKPYSCALVNLAEISEINGDPNPHFQG